MQVGLDLGASESRLAWISATLGAGPRSWGAHNRRTATVPSWIAMDLADGPASEDSDASISCGEDAVLRCADPAFQERVKRDEAVAWPRFPRRAARHPGNLHEGVEVFWLGLLRRWRERGIEPERYCVTACLELERLIADAFRAVPLSILPKTLPDFFASYLASGPVPDEQRVAYVDLGAEALRIVTFRTWSEAGEQWVVIEQSREDRPLGMQAVHSRMLEGGMSPLPQGLDFWLAMERLRKRYLSDTLTPSEAGRLTNEMDAASLWVRTALEDVAVTCGGIDIILLNDPGFMARQDYPARRLHALDPYDPACGAALFGAVRETPVHFVMEVSLYASVNGSAPIVIAPFESLMALGPDRHTYTIPYANTAGGPVEVALLWGPAGASGPLRTLSWQSVEPGRAVLETPVVCRARRQGSTLFGDIGILSCEAEVGDGEPWRLDMDHNAFWSVM